MPLAPIIEPLELLERSDVLLFDAGGSPEARSRYETEHLKGALYVDLEVHLSRKNSDAASGGRHPLPHKDEFAQTLTKLGLSKNSHVVIYDDKNGANAAARFWWMLVAAGHEKVQVLNGGLARAKASNFPMSSGTVEPRKASEPYRIEDWVLQTAGMDEVEHASQQPNSRVIDVRSKERYDGITEPIDLIAGHIPGAINIPYTENLDPNGDFLRSDQLKSLYESKIGHMIASEHTTTPRNFIANQTAQRNIDPKNIIVHCGSGVTACHTLLALSHAGLPIPKLYVGSWSEWSRNDKPIGSKTAN